MHEHPKYRNKEDITHQYDKLLSYIEYFSTAGEEVGTWVCESSVFPYVNYSKELLSFIDAVYETDLIDKEYLPYLEQHFPRDNNPADYIDTADFRLLRAILTFFVRQERFCDGLWQGAVTDKTFYRILLRLKDFLPEDHKQ